MAQREPGGIFLQLKIKKSLNVIFLTAFKNLGFEKVNKITMPGTHKLTTQTIDNKIQIQLVHKVFSKCKL